MINIAFLIMIKYNIYLQEIKYKKEIETVHINFQLRFQMQKNKPSFKEKLISIYRSQDKIEALIEGVIPRAIV